MKVNILTVGNVVVVKIVCNIATNVPSLHAVAGLKDKISN